MERTILLFNNLLQDCNNFLSQSELDEVKHFLDFDEYGLALETLASICIEGEKKLPTNLISKIIDLAKHMDMQIEATSHLGVLIAS